MQVGRAMAIALGVGALGCLAGDGTGGMGGPPPPPPPPPEDVSFSADIQPILTTSCALTNCHVAPMPAQQMNLSEGQAYTNIVNVPSTEAVASPMGRATTLLRVEPGNADSSYFIIKLEGDQNLVGGFGGTMPINADPLDQMIIDMIRAWIDAGAADN